MEGIIMMVSYLPELLLLPELAPKFGDWMFEIGD